MDSDAEVRIMAQQSWPFENAIQGVTARDEFAEEITEDKEGNTVFLVEGRQICYGDEKAWEEC